MKKCKVACCALKHRLMLVPMLKLLDFEQSFEV
jgi:hypothetical protein